MKEKDEVVEFIHRRFPKDSDWCNGNCYFFAVILKAAFPHGRIWYLPVINHFVFLYRWNLYDWTGDVTKKYQHEPVRNWDEFQQTEPLEAKRIIRDCCS